MIIKAFCIIVLLCLANPLFPQEAEASHAGVNLNVIKTDSLKAKNVSLQNTQTRGCVSSFTNQTVSSAVSVQGCTTLAVQNVTVTYTGNLTLSAPGDITINGAFEVKGGGVLNVTTGKPQRKRISYDYDPSGNRIVRLSTE